MNITMEKFHASDPNPKPEEVEAGADGDDYVATQEEIAAVGRMSDEDIRYPSGRED